MKKFNKTLLAAALMIAAGSANAALTNGSTTGTNEAYLVAFDANYVNTDGSFGRSYNLDLGTTFAALQAGASSALSAFTGAGKSLAADANWTAFKTLSAGETAANITYGVYAAGDTSSQANNGIFVTGAAAPTAPIASPKTTPAGSLTTWGGVIGAINQHANEISLGAFTTSSVVKGTDTASTGQADSVPTFETVWGSSANPLAAYGSADSFYYGGTHLGSQIQGAGTAKSPFKTVNGLTLLAQSDISLIGAFTLAGNTLSYAPAAVSAVPLPAAVWMFGAGLMGVLRLNRRKSVQA